MYELISIQERSRWKKLLDTLHITEIYYTNQYFLGALKLDPGEALLFHYKDDEGEVVYPFIKRQVSEEETTFYDVTTPFGYGGPLLKVENSQANLAANFREAFREYCKSEKIIAEYIRFHPLTENANIFQSYLNVSPLFNTYTINLKDKNNPYEKIQLNSRKEDQNDKNLVVKKLGTVRHMFEFLVLYYAAARRREEADSYYFFTNDYFETLISSMGSDLHLFGVYHEEKLVTACYVLAMGDTIFYHLEGSVSDVYSENTMRILLLKIAEWGEENYYSFFHLGGDFRGHVKHHKQIKKEIANCEPSKFYIGQKIHDQQTYDSLVSVEEQDVIRRYRNI
ncbi:GNAT family N-acetyltransferase [Planococcus donghaensis]|uniref:GNAT family N-acetyltransferase n=1 Tax=Planococcus donghaensis TaxID=414778 RepID=A0A1C7EFA4_9BACL|nr:GNAT family N-acetyltransferase [Planococcus donghaensis]ANU22644.1 GNAT family N-acetyltransferase [Planococcus donghaensis]